MAPEPGKVGFGGTVGGSEGRAPTVESGPSPAAGEAVVYFVDDEIFERLEDELLAAIRRYADDIKKLYKGVDDPQYLDAAIDFLIAEIVREFESTGYAFDTASVDNVLYALNRKIDAEEWEVVER